MDFTTDKCDLEMWLTHFMLSTPNMVDINIRLYDQH